MSCSRSDDEWAMAALIARYLGLCLFFLKASPTLRITPLPTLGIVTNPFFLRYSCSSCFPISVFCNPHQLKKWTAQVPS